jgi:uncharacterized protein (TIGR03067 family)
MRTLVLVPLLAILTPSARALPPPTQSAISRLIEQLGSPSFPEREAASRSLETIGDKALPALQKAKTASDAEVRRRAGRIFRRVIEDLTERERQKLDGLWRASAVEEQGKAESLETHEYMAVFAENRLTIGAMVGRYKRWWNGHRYTFTLDVAGNRGAIDLTPRYREFDGVQIGIEDGSRRGGIYVMEGNRLKLCLNMKGAQRPSKFATEPGSGLVLFVFERPRR